MRQAGRHRVAGVGPFFRRPCGCVTLLVALLALLWQAAWIERTGASPWLGVGPADMAAAMPLAPPVQADAVRAADPAQRPFWSEPGDPPLLPLAASPPATGAGAAPVAPSAGLPVPKASGAYASRAPPDLA